MASSGNLFATVPPVGHNGSLGKVQICDPSTAKKGIHTKNKWKEKLAMKM